MTKYRRLPNGYGSVTKLTGKRRYPYNAKTPVLDYDETGKPLRFSLGCFSTRQEAINAINDWHADRGHYVQPDQTTVAEVFKAMLEKKENIADMTRRSYVSSFAVLRSLHDRPIRAVRLAELQTAIDNTGRSRSGVSMCICVLKLIYGYAIKNDIVEKDYTRFLENKGAVIPRPENKYVDIDALARIKRLAADGDRVAQVIVFMCYTGFRVSAYQTLEIDEEKRLLRGGVKTKESKGRIVPIKEEIMPYLYLFPAKYDSCKSRAALAAFCATNGFPAYTFHYFRHTFKYLCDLAGVDGVTSRSLMGHSLGADIHDAVYSHRDIAQLQAAISSLPW